MSEEDFEGLLEWGCLDEFMILDFVQYDSVHQSEEVEVKSETDLESVMISPIM